MEIDFASSRKSRVLLFLHAVNNGKPVFRISTKFSALPKVPMIITNKMKARTTISTSGAHKSFRKKNG